MGLFDAFDFGINFDFGGGEAAPFDFGVPVDLGGGEARSPFDFGTFSFDVPGFTDFGEIPGGGFDVGQGLGGYFFDTTSGDIVNPAGQRVSLADIAAGGGGTGGRGEPGLFGRGSTLGAGGPADQFMRSGVGGALTTGALGLTGLGLSRLLAGESPTLQLPQPRVSAGITAGEEALRQALGQGAQANLVGAAGGAIAGQNILAGTLAARAAREGAAEAEQAPGQRDIRLAAQGQIPGLMTPTAAGTFEDPVQQLLTSQIMATLQGTAGDPTQEARRQREQATFENQMARQLGPDWRLTTPGIQSQQQLEQRFNQERFAEKEAMISSRLPQQQSRQQFAYLAPVQRAQGLETIRRPALTDAERLSQIGISGVPETLTGLRAIAPVSGFLSPEGAQNAANLGTSLEAQQALAGFNQQTQQQREMAQAISGLFGQVASSATQRRSPFEDYMANLLRTQGAPA